MSLYKTEGVVLHQFELGEADKIITYYTRDRGKIRVVAKGVRRTLSSKASSTQLFTYADLLIYRGKSLDKLSQTSIKESFSKLREDLLRMAYGTYILDLVKELTVEEDPNEAMFVLLLKTLHLLMETDDLELITRIFEIRAMTLMGFRPVLDRCLECGGLISEDRLKFHPGSGGLVCSECGAKMSGRTVNISRGTVEIMKRFLISNYTQLMKLKLPEYAQRELEMVMELFVQYHLDHNLKSLDFLKSVKEMDK
ncbi:DNA repair protein RecO [Anoxybacter fermentans]|uniref:DNA repair protein RecO n=1 Tax=Anoxybacter fermentans TaxID=1323375 RepID=A0A3S9SXY6_9FIRM|nr:DNA repair protein RecO [Anoxybacter fermentans]AZR73145.1 DNA repair protein RecO [Anoxybacter fermentans]